MKVNVHLLVCSVLVHTLKPALVKTLTSSSKLPTKKNVEKHCGKKHEEDLFYFRFLFLPERPQSDNISVRF